MFAAALWAVSLGWSFNSRSSEMDDFKAPWLEIHPPGVLESKPETNGPLKLFFDNVPTGKIPRGTPNECSSLELSRVMAHSAQPQIQASMTQEFLSRCEKKFNSFAPSKYFAILKMAEGNYPLQGYENLREVVLRLPYNSIVHGLLALKDLKRARPLVIVICGSAVDLSDSFARVFLSEIFDTTPFNILILPSVSGNDFVRENRRFGLGGFEEGRRTFEVVRLLGGEDSPLRHLISSFHIIGASLGGNGALFTSVYGSYNNDKLTGPKIQSVMALCPVVDLKASLSDLDRDDLTGKHFTNLIFDTILGNFLLVFGAGHDMPTLYKPGHRQSVPFLENVLYPEYKALARVENFILPPFSEKDLATPEDFWNDNNFLLHYDQVNIPTVAFYSKDDFVVAPKSNSEALAKELKLHPNPAVNLLHLKAGSHCVASEVYGNDIADGVVENFILTNSPEFPFSQGHQSLDLPRPKNAEDFNLDKGEKYFGYYWGVRKGQKTAKATIKVFEGKNPDDNDADDVLDTCRRSNPYYADLGCFRLINVSVPLTTFFPTLQGGSPSSDAQAQELTRWLNGRVHLLTENGLEPVDTAAVPTTIDWTSD